MDADLLNKLKQSFKNSLPNSDEYVTGSFEKPYIVLVSSRVYDCIKGTLDENDMYNDADGWHKVEVYDI